MHKVSASVILLATCLPQIYAAAVALPGTKDNVNLVARRPSPHYFASIDLDDFEAHGNSSLAKRTDVQVCEYDRYKDTGSYLFSEDTLEFVGGAIASAFKSAAANNDCSHFQNRYGGTPSGLNWDLYSVRSDGGADCGTTAQTGTINGAFQKFFRQHGLFDNGVMCLQLSHGGTWRGYVSFAWSKYNAAQYDCGPHSPNLCVSGGNGDCKGSNCGA